MIGSQLLLLLRRPDEDANRTLAYPRFSDFAIVTSLNQYFSENYSLAANAVYCNETPDLDSTLNMVELLVSTFEVPRYRKSSKRRVRVDVLVHIWYRAESSLYGALDMADEVESVLDQKVIPIRDYLVSGEPQVGTLQLQEAKTDDLSERQEEDLGLNFQHLLVRVRGVAQEG